MTYETEHDNGLFEIDPDWELNELEYAKEVVCDRITLLEEEMMNIDGQIQMHTVRASVGEFEIDTVWVNRARIASKYRRTAIQRLRRALNEVERLLKQARKAAHTSDFERLFVDAARRVLPREMFDAVRLEASQQFNPL